MDGAFERINAAILKEGTNSQVISLVGRVVGYDGNGQATVEAADGGMVQVTNVEPAFNYVEGMIAEIMGAPIGGDSIQVSCFVGCSCLIFLPTKLSENSRISYKSYTQHTVLWYTWYTNYHLYTQQHSQYFLCRNLGDDFDLTNYNKLIYNVMKNQRYADLY